MVTTTEQNDDDIPTHDAYGTDLRRVRAMIARGFSDRLIGESLGISRERARHAILVATDDRQGAPTPSEIASACHEIQSGWTAEMAAAARRGEPRLSSTTVRVNHRETRERVRQAVVAYWARTRERRVEEQPIPITVRPGMERPFRAHVRLRNRGQNKCFATREEAEAWGREWLRVELKRLQDESCCGAGCGGSIREV